MDRDRDELAQLLRDRGALIRTDEPIELASGEMSRDFIDAKLAVARPDDLDRVGRAMAAAPTERGIEFDAVGGLVLGSVPFTFAVAAAARCGWFMIRKEAKGRGTNRHVEGAPLGPDTRVLLVDDVVTTGGSIVTAYERVVAEGARVVFATTLVDRGDEATSFFESQGIPYQPMLTYADLGIEPIGRGPRPTAAAG